MMNLANLSTFCFSRFSYTVTQAMTLE